jgi:hypothetical protein
MPVPTNFVDWLGSRPWELSNVNWWPNFPLTGYLAKEMVRREGGGDVAGVVAITQEIMEPLIAATGPVNVPGYSPVVAKDLEQRILDEVELKQPPDIPQHKFLALLSTQLFDRILHLEPTKVGNIATVASQAAATGDMQAWFADPAQEAAVTGTTWSGALPQNNGDFLLLADANMRASKANKNLERDVTYTVDRDDKGQLVGHVHAVFKNNGLPSKLNPTYLGYVRVYTPAGSRLLGGVPWTRDNDTAVGGKPRDEGRAPDGPYQVFSTVVQADPQKQATFDMRYVLPDSVDEAGHYNLTWVRQTGAGNDRLSANILGHSTPTDPQNRVADISVDLNPHGLRGFLHRRWIFRPLGI